MDVRSGVHKEGRKEETGRLSIELLPCHTHNFWEVLPVQKKFVVQAFDTYTALLDQTRWSYALSVKTISLQITFRQCNNLHHHTSFQPPYQKLSVNRSKSHHYTIPSRANPCSSKKTARSNYVHHEMTSKQKREKGGVKVTWQPTVLLKNTDSNEERRVYHEERKREWLARCCGVFVGTESE